MDTTDPHASLYLGWQIGHVYQVPDTRPNGIGTRIIFYSWMVLVFDPNQDGYGAVIFFHPRIIRRVPDAFLLL
jgi:hypothetical protein